MAMQTVSSEKNGYANAPQGATSLLNMNRHPNLGAAWGERALFKYLPEIVSFRFMQYLGTYRGHNEHRRLSRAQKEAYFYPKPPKDQAGHAEPATLVAAERQVIRAAE